MADIAHDDILTLSEVAEYLKISEKTLLKMVNSGEIPSAKIGNQWRFSRAMINDWLISKMKVLPQNDLSLLIEREYDFVPLSRLIAENAIIMDMKSTGRDSAVRELAESAFANNLISDKEEYAARLIEREEMTSTALGRGIALPHLRKMSSELASSPSILIGISRNGVDFNSHDTKKTHLFFCIISDSEVVHLRIMARLARILRNEGIVETFMHFVKPKEFTAFFIERENEQIFGDTGL